MADQELAPLTGGSNPRRKGARQFGMEPPVSFGLLVQGKEVNHLPVFFVVKGCLVRHCRRWPRVQRAKVSLAHHGIVRQKHPRPESSESAFNHIEIKLVLVRTAGPGAVGASQTAAFIVYKTNRFLRGSSELKAFDEKQVVLG